MIGWNEEEVHGVLDVMDDIYNASYELKNCIRGCYTGAHTYPELSNYLCELAAKLQEEAENLASVQEIEEEE